MSYVYEEYDASLLRSRFEDYDRVSNFGYDGIDALFDYLEELAEGMGEPVKIDIIGLCCDYSRYESVEDFQVEYGEDYKTLEDIRDKTTVILIDGEEGPFIIQSF